MNQFERIPERSTSINLEDLHFILAADIESFRGIWPRTDDMLGATAHAFQCADVLEAWIDTLGAARRTEILLALVSDKSGRPLMGLPLGIETQYGLRSVSFLDGSVSDYNAPVIFPGCPVWSRPDFLKIWARLIKLLPAFDVIHLTKLPPQIGQFPNPLLHLGGTKGIVSGHCATVPSPEAFAQRQPPQAKTLRRKQRRLAEVGHCSFLVAATQADRKAILDALMRHKARKYIDTRGFDGFERPGFRDYYLHLTSQTPVSGPVHLSALLVNGEIVASHWGLVADGCFYSLMPAFDSERWSRFSPGRILIEHLFEWSAANGIRLLDFGVGDEPYKDDYCDRAIPLRDVVIPHSLKGAVFAALRCKVNVLRETSLWVTFKQSRAGHLVRRILKR